MAFESTSLYVKTALAKQAAGQKLTGNESARLERLGHTPPNVLNPEQIDGLRDYVRRHGGGNSDSDIVADLIASGATFEEFTICDSGSPASRWLPTWTADPTP